MPNRVDSPNPAGPLAGVIARAGVVGFGAALCGVVALVAVSIQAAEEAVVGHPYVDIWQAVRPHRGAMAPCGTA